MPLNPVQVQWLEEITGAATRKEKSDEIRALKSTALTSIRAEVGTLQQELTEQFTFDVTKSAKKRPNPTQKSIHASGDQVEEFDLDEVREGYWFVTDEEYQTPEGKEKADKVLGRIMKGHESLDALRKKLEAVTYDRHENDKVTKVRAFTDDEISEELYKPLVRSRAMPETLVPDRFSETQKMLDGTYEAYKKKVDESSDEPGFFTRVKDDIKGGDGMVVGFTEYLLDNLSAHATTQGLNSSNPSLLSHVGPLSGVQTSKNALFDHLPNAVINTGVVSNFMALSGMVEAGDIVLSAISKGNAISRARSNTSDEPPPLPAKPLAASVVGHIGGAIESGLSRALGGDRKFAQVPKSLSKAFATKADFTKIAALLGAEEPKIADVADLLGKAIEDAFTACGLAAQGEKAKKGLLGVVSVKSKDLKEAIKGRQQTAVCRIFALAGAAAIEAIKTNLGNLEVRGVVEGLAKIQDEAVQAEMSALAGSNAQRDKDLKELSEVEAAQHAEKYVGVIERKARDIEQANATLDMAVKLVAGGSSVLSTLFEPLAAAGALVKFMANLKHAIDRASDSAAWVQNQSDLIKACSPYSQAAKNFAHNQWVHKVHYRVNAGLELLKMAAAVAGTTGADFGAGKAAGTVLAGVSLVEGVIYKIKMKYDLEAGYKAFVRASQNPKNRKAGLQGLIKNPTLAKYAIAWGAYIKKDPLAVHAISSAGLNEKDLEDEKAGLDKVVDYLQTRYPEDNVILRKLASVSWSPGKIELTVECWIRTKAQAQRDADLAAKPPTADIERAFLNAQRAQRALAEAKDGPNEAVFADAIDAFDALDHALRNYTPKTNAQVFTFHRAMHDVALGFAALAKKEAAAVANERAAWAEQKPGWVLLVPLSLCERAWTPILSQAEVLVQPPVAEGGGKDISSALKAYDQADEALRQKGNGAVQNDYLAAINAVRKVIEAFRKYQPVNKGDRQPHAGMRLIAAKFAALARARLDELIAKSDELFPLK